MLIVLVYGAVCFVALAFVLCLFAAAEERAWDMVEEPWDGWDGEEPDFEDRP